jgi:hypothetical protein
MNKIGLPYIWKPNLCFYSTKAPIVKKRITVKTEFKSNFILNYRTRFK